MAIDQYDLGEGFIPTFLTPLRIKDEDAIGNSMIVMFQRDEAYYYNMTPIIRLAQQAKRLRITITYSRALLSSHDDNFMALANKFFHPASAPLLHDYLETAVEKIILFVDNDLSSIVFQLYLREDFYECEWMDECNYRYKYFAEPISEDTERAMAIWGKNCGLEIDSSYGGVGCHIGFARPLVVGGIDS